MKPSQPAMYIHLNLLKITAMMSKTRTVMMAMVMIRFVAILCHTVVSIPTILRTGTRI